MSAYISGQIESHCCLKIKISHKFGCEATNCWDLPAANVNELSQVRIGLIYIKVAWAIYTKVKHASKHIHWNYLLSWAAMTTWLVVLELLHILARHKV